MSKKAKTPIFKTDSLDLAAYLNYCGIYITVKRVGPELWEFRCLDDEFIDECMCEFYADAISIDLHRFMNIRNMLKQRMRRQPVKGTKSPVLGVGQKYWYVEGGKPLAALWGNGEPHYTRLSTGNVFLELIDAQKGVNAVKA